MTFFTRPFRANIKTSLSIVPVILTGIFITACGGETPARSWELADQGLFTGAFSNQSQMAIIGSMNHGASLWRMTDKERLFNWSHQNGEFTDIAAAGFSPDSTRAVTTQARTLVFWDTQTGAALQYWGTPGVVLDVALLNDNRHVLMGLKDHSALLFNAQTGSYQQTLLHEGEVSVVAVSFDGELAITGSDDHKATIWKLNDGTPLHEFSHGSPVRAVAISPQGTYAFTSAKRDLVAIWHVESGRRLHVLHDGINNGASTAVFSDDERFLAVGYANRRVALFDVSSGALIKEWDIGTKLPLARSAAAIIEIGFGATANIILALAGDGRLLELRS